MNPGNPGHYARDIGRTRLHEILGLDLKLGRLIKHVFRGMFRRSDPRSYLAQFQLTGRLKGNQ